MGVVSQVYAIILQTNLMENLWKKVTSGETWTIHGDLGVE
jgi:hypothetical protein